MKHDTNARSKVQALARRRQWFGALALTLICFSLGTVLGYIPELTEKLTDREEDLLQYAPSIGGMIGAPLGGMAVEVVGRKKTVIAFALPIILGWILVGVEYTFVTTFVGRLLSGLGGGAGLVAVIVFVSELAEDIRRGILLCLVQLMLLSGYLFVDIFRKTLSSQTMAYICALFPALSLSMTTHIPDSARFLVKKHRLAYAAKSVAWFRGSDIPEVAQERIQAKSRSVERSKSLTPMTRALGRSTVKPFLIVTILILMYEMSGFSTVLAYRQLLLYKPGLLLTDNLLLLIIGIIALMVTAMAAFVVDWAGRRILVLISGALTTSALVTLGTYYYITHEDYILGARPTHVWIPLGSCLVYLFGFSMGIGPIPWVLMGELLPPNYKGYCLIPIIFYWFFHNLLVYSEREITRDVYIYWKFWFPSCFCLFGTLFLLCTLPETRKQRMEKIEEFFFGHNSPRVKSKALAPRSTDHGPNESAGLIGEKPGPSVLVTSL